MEKLDFSNIAIIPPEMEIRAFAKLTGLTEETLKAQIKRGYIHSFKRGRKRLINTAKIYNENINR